MYVWRALTFLAQARNIISAVICGKSGIFSITITVIVVVVAVATTAAAVVVVVVVVVVVGGGGGGGGGWKVI
jgi:hypothetical protein